MSFLSRCSCVVSYNGSRYSMRRCNVSLPSSSILHQQQMSSRRHFAMMRGKTKDRLRAKALSLKLKAAAEQYGEEFLGKAYTKRTKDNIFMKNELRESIMLREHFNTHGYWICPDVLNSEDMKGIRRFFRRAVTGLNDDGGRGHSIEEKLTLPGMATAVRLVEDRLLRRSKKDIKLASMSVEGRKIEAQRRVMNGEAVSFIRSLEMPHKAGNSALINPMTNPYLLMLLGRLTGLESLKLVHSSIVVSRKGRKGPPFFQALGRIPAGDDGSLISVFIALDPMAVGSGCPWIVPGSHKTGHVYRTKCYDNGNVDPGIPGVLGTKYDGVDDGGVPCILSAGDAVFMHGALLQRTQLNSEMLPSGISGARTGLVLHFMDNSKPLPWDWDGRLSTVPFDMTDVVPVNVPTTDDAITSVSRESVSTANDFEDSGEEDEVISHLIRTPAPLVDESSDTIDHDNAVHEDVTYSHIVLNTSSDDSDAHIPPRRTSGPIDHSRGGLRIEYDDIDEGVSDDDVPIHPNLIQYRKQQVEPSNIPIIKQGTVKAPPPQRWNDPLEALSRSELDEPLKARPNEGLPNWLRLSPGSYEKQGNDTTRNRLKV